MRGEFAALGASFCWALGSHLFGRIGRGGAVAPGALNLGKCVSAALLFAGALAVLEGTVVPRVHGADALVLAASGFIGLALGDSCYFGAMAELGVRRAMLLLSTAPVFTAIGGFLVLGERLRWIEGASIAAVMAGVTLVVHERSRASNEGRSTRRLGRGILLGLGAGLGQAIGSLMARRALEHVGALDAALVRIAAGLVGLAALAAMSGRLAGWVRALSVKRTMGAVAISASIGTFAGVWLAQFAIGHATSTAIASTFLALPPLFALPLGRWFDQEPTSARALGGTALACGGLCAIALANR